MASWSFETIAVWWCKQMHDDISWPSYGKYRCTICNRTYPVPWEQRFTRPSVHAKQLGQASDKVKPVPAS